MLIRSYLWNGHALQGCTDCFVKISHCLLRAAKLREYLTLQSIL